MENKIVEKLVDALKKFKGQNTKVEQRGFISIKIFIKNLQYKIEYDILKIEDIEEEIYVYINLNQAYEIEIQDTQISLKLDNDIQIKLSL